MNPPEAVPGPGGLLQRPYRFLKLEWSPQQAVLQMRLCIRPLQCYSLAGMAEMQQVLNDITEQPGLVRHFVLRSDVPGVFNFGGDLALFVLLVRARDGASLRMYGRRCIDLVWWVERAAALGIHTTALIQGDALGGGLESALPFHRVIMERSASGGFPEVLFNLFPGMGGWQYMLRRSSFAIANDMILTGTICTAEDLRERGLVDWVVDDGQGDEALRRSIRSLDPHLPGTLGALEARRRVAPITYDSLVDVVERWAEAALALTERDLRLMERLTRAQARKIGGVGEGAIDELKRMELETAWRETSSGLTQWD